MGAPEDPRKCLCKACTHCRCIIRFISNSCSFDPTQMSYVCFLVPKCSPPTVVGVSVASFLLETSRVAMRSAGERNFHVFYELEQYFRPSHYDTKDFVFRRSNGPETNGFSYPHNMQYLNDGLGGVSSGNGLERLPVPGMDIDSVKKCINPLL